MDALELLRLNLLSPMVLAYFLGVAARLLKSDLAFPEALYTALSIYLLFAIGFKGGVELSHTPLAVVLLPALLTLALGLFRPFPAYLLARRFLRVGREDAAALAAHYGSVSAVTFLAALTFVQAVGDAAPGFMPTLVALLEVPGIVVALLLAKRREGRLGEALHEVLTGKSVVLLLGGLLVGLLSGEEGMKKVEAFFVEPFQGALTLFLLDLGMVAAIEAFRPAAGGPSPRPLRRGPRPLPRGLGGVPGPPCGPRGRGRRCLGPWRPAPPTSPPPPP